MEGGQEEEGKSLHINETIMTSARARHMRSQSFSQPRQFKNKLSHYRILEITPKPANKADLSIASNKNQFNKSRQDVDSVLNNLAVKQAQARLVAQMNGIWSFDAATPARTSRSRPRELGELDDAFVARTAKGTDSMARAHMNSNKGIGELNRADLLSQAKADRKEHNNSDNQ